MPRAQVESSLERAPDGTLLVHLKNVSKALAFQVNVDGVDTSGNDVSPLPWSDNYIELMPGESRILTARPTAAQTVTSIIVTGWNIPSITLKDTLRDNASLRSNSNLRSGGN